MVVKKLISTVTGLFLAIVMGGAPAAAQQPKSLAADSVFIQTAGSIGLLQVKLGKLAEEKGRSAAVVEFGKRMVSDYSKTNEELKTAAKAAGFQTPVLSRRNQQIFERFNSMGRSGFDKAYMMEMVKQHSEEARLYQAEAAGGRVQSLRQLASRMLPQVEQRQSLATETAGSVGADVTASTAAAGEGSPTY